MTNINKIKTLTASALLVFAGAPSAWAAFPCDAGQPCEGKCGPPPCPINAGVCYHQRQEGPRCYNKKIYNINYWLKCNKCTYPSKVCTEVCERKCGPGGRVCWNSCKKVCTDGEPDCVKDGSHDCRYGCTAAVTNQTCDSPPESCTPKTCSADYPGRCGTFADGCGGAVTCGCPGGHQNCVAGKCLPDDDTCLKRGLDWKEVPVPYYPHCPECIQSGDCKIGFQSDGYVYVCLECYTEQGQNCEVPKATACRYPYKPYTEILRVKCPSGAVHNIAGSKTEASPFHVRKGTTTYNAALVPIGHADQSCVSVRASTATFRLRKM